MVTHASQHSASRRKLTVCRGEDQCTELDVWSMEGFGIFDSFSLQILSVYSVFSGVYLLWTKK